MTHSNQAPDFSTCRQCGGGIDIKQQQRFRAKATFKLKRGGPMPDGPFCGTTCRAKFASELAQDRLVRLIEKNQ